MNLVASETSLVVAGAWNGAILTPEWMLRYGLGQTREEAQGVVVQASLPAGPFGALEPPRFTLPGFTYAARPDALVLMPAAVDEPSLELLARCAAGVVSTLQHTPMAGIGHNLEFASNDSSTPRPDSFALSQNDLVDCIPQDWEAFRTVLASQFNVDGIQVNVQRFVDPGRVGVKFNFHHPISDATAALKVLKAEGYRSFWQNYQIACEIVEKLFGEKK